MYKLLVWLLLLVWVCWAGRSPTEWQSRTVYQLLTDRFANPAAKSDCGNLETYCGGTFQGIIQRLDYIIGMGFDAIWISPVIVNTPDGYHGYWAKDFFNINPNFGTANDLKQLVDACHAKGVWVMVDIVANHAGPIGDDFGQIQPFNSSSYYHPDCQVTQYTCFTDQVLRCRLADLPDLDQSNTYVRNELLSWIKWLMGTFNFDGVRADTVMYINQQFWVDFTAAAGSYIVGEVYSDINCNIAYQKQGVPATLSYPMFFTLRSVFQGQQSMRQIESQFFAYQSFPNPGLLGTFIDNHDQARFLNNNDNKQPQYYSAITYVLLSAGIPIIYYGTEQGFDGGNDPYCREALWKSNYDTSNSYYQFIKTVISFRKQAQVWNSPQVQRYADTNFYAFTRGLTFVALSNANDPVTRSITYHPYSDGTRLCNIFSGGSDCVTVQNGQFSVTLDEGLPKIYYPK